MPRTVKQSQDLIESLNESRSKLQLGMNTLKHFADAQSLMFADLETDLVSWSFDDRLLFDFNLTTTPIVSDSNREDEGETIQNVLEYITRGIESYALWHRLRYSEVRITNIYWATYHTMIVEYGSIL